MGSRYTLGSKNRRATMLEPNITNSMKQQLLVTIPQFSPFAFTMILMISDMEIDNHTLGSTNRSPQLDVACVRNFAMTFCLIRVVDGA